MNQKQQYIDAILCLYRQPSKLFGDGRMTDALAWVHVMGSFKSALTPARSVTKGLTVISSLQAYVLDMAPLFHLFI